jgi:2,3-bisphosphoglycerate-independent phosphoglycerate mutase
MEMDVSEVWENLIEEQGGSIIYLIMDGVGGLSNPETGKTELQTANTPNLDRLARVSSCGLLETVGPGITPGSGPGHLALFGYDPLRYRIGRGILAALGIDFELREGDVAARANFATLDQEGRVKDRRAGRISTEENRRLCEKIRRKVKLDFQGEFFFETVGEHRALLVLRGENLNGDIGATDPQKTGVHPLDPDPISEGAAATAGIVRDFLGGVKEVLQNEDRANTILLRGFDTFRPLPSLGKRFGLRSMCIAQYPMYRGLSRLVGMEVLSPPQDMEDSFKALQNVYGDKFDFYFLHLKKTDSSGEDGDFEKKVKIIEMIDELVPAVTDLKPDVLIVTADHSTPSTMAYHSWHPVPVCIHSPFTRVDDVQTFDESSCLHGALGIRPGLHLMGLALANARRLKKFGA